MAKISAIKSDLQKEVEGVWQDFSMGIRLKIARARNPKYLEMLRVLMQPHRGDVRTDEMDAEIFQGILKEVRAKTILLDWENIEDDDGKPILYSSDQASAFFNDPELKDFYTFVTFGSENADLYRKGLIEDSVKN